MNLCIMQARMNSSRLPGKVLMEVCGKTLLEHEACRLMYAKKIDKLVIATTTSQADDEIERLCTKNKICCYRGSEDDVLDRYYKAAVSSGANSSDTVIRITADCPLIDPEIIDKIINLFYETNVDYASNTNPPTYPDGLDVEAFKFAALEKAWKEARLLSEREHVTPYIKKHPELFKHVNLKCDSDLSYLRWTVDEQEDFEVIKTIYEKLYKTKEIFLTEDILKFISESPEIQEKNIRFKRDEGYEKSLKNDRVLD